MRQRETKKVEKKKTHINRKYCEKKRRRNIQRTTNRRITLFAHFVRWTHVVLLIHSRQHVERCARLVIVFAIYFFFLLFCKFRHLLFIVLFRLCIPFNVAVFDGFFSKKCTKAHNKKVTCTETHTSNKWKKKTITTTKRSKTTPI